MTKNGVEPSDHDPTRREFLWTLPDQYFFRYLRKNAYLLAIYLVPILFALVLLTAGDRFTIQLLWLSVGSKYALAAIGFLYVCYLVASWLTRKDVDGLK